MRDIYSKVLSNIKIFKLNFSSEFLDELALSLKEKRLGPDEVIL